MKKILTLLLVAILSLSTIFMFACDDNKPETNPDNNIVVTPENPNDDIVTPEEETESVFGVYKFYSMTVTYVDEDGEPIIVSFEIGENFYGVTLTEDYMVLELMSDGTMLNYSYAEETVWSLDGENFSMTLIDIEPAWDDETGDYLYDENGEIVMTESEETLYGTLKDGVLTFLMVDEEFNESEEYVFKKAEPTSATPQELVGVYKFYSLTDECINEDGETISSKTLNLGDTDDYDSIVTEDYIVIELRPCGHLVLIEDGYKYGGLVWKLEEGALIFVEGSEIAPIAVSIVEDTITMIQIDEDEFSNTIKTTTVLKKVNA